MREVWDGSVSAMLGDDDAYEAFVASSPQVLRAMYLSKALPPVGLALPAETCVPVRAEQQLLKCQLTLDCGTECCLFFPSRQGLLSHQRFASGGSHGVRQLLSQLTLTNQCVLCASTFFKQEHC